MSGHTDFDSELRRHDAVLRRAAGVGRRDHVLDVGCGTGSTTRHAARAATGGTALGVDVAAPAIERARALARAEGLANVTFEVGDAQVHALPRARFDVAISRFGTMFFADPVAAFTNLARALRPGGRLVMAVWQAAERNEWDVVLRERLGTRGSPAPGADPFSLADPGTVTRTLHAAGFGSVAFVDVHEPVHYGDDVETALDWVRGFTCTREALAGLTPDGAALAVERVRAALADHLGDDGVRFDSRAWVVTARRAG